MPPYLAYRLLNVTTRNRKRREGIMLDFAYAYAFPLFSIPLLAVMICFVVTRIWGD
jgi:hypothetical protein